MTLKKMKRTGLIVMLLAFGYIYTLQAANDKPSTISGVAESDNQLRAVQTTVPFMTIAPDSRAASMGDAGVATSPDLYSQHWNSSKYLFMEDRSGFGLSYTPWLQSLNVSDLNLVYLAGYMKLDDRQVVSAGLRYFNLGRIQMTDNTGRSIGDRYPNEFAVDAGYSMKLGEYLGGGLVLRFIYSDIAGGSGIINNLDYNPGVSFAADLSTYYQRSVRLGDYNGEMAYGVNISNMGSKMSYSEGDTKEFIPTNLRLGGRLSVDLDDYNALAVTVDFNKLLVPTPPLTTPGGDTIIAGLSDDVTLIPGMIQSFYDAPGLIDKNGNRSKFREEMSEVIIGGGIEYWYQKQFAARVGYFYEHESKGNRKYLTAGIGLKLNVFTIDVSYLSSLRRTSPLDRTMRFTLGFLFE